MPWAAAVITAGAGVYQAKKAGEAAELSAEGYERAGQLSQRQFEQTRNDLRPFRETGTRALEVLGRVHALGGGTPDYSAFKQSPGYRFRLEEGNKALERSAAARGMTMSGAQLKSLSRYNQGMASQEFDNWHSRMAGLAGAGQSAAVQTGQFGANAANQTGMAYIGAGNAKAGGVIGKTNAYTNALAGLAQLYGQYQGMGGMGKRKSGYSPANGNETGDGKFYGPLAQGGM